MPIEHINSTNFQKKYSTSKVLEITTRKIIDSDGVNGYINALKEIHGNVPKYLGHLGYKRYAIEAGDKIIAKYPQIASATQEILNIVEKEPNILPKELRERVKPILDKMDKEIDIVI